MIFFFFTASKHWGYFMIMVYCTTVIYPAKVYNTFVRDTATGIIGD